MCSGSSSLAVVMSVIIALTSCDGAQIQPYKCRLQSVSHFDSRVRMEPLCFPLEALQLWPAASGAAASSRCHGALQRAAFQNVGPEAHFILHQPPALCPANAKQTVGQGWGAGVGSAPTGRSPVCGPEYTCVHWGYSLQRHLVQVYCH